MAKLLPPYTLCPLIEHRKCLGVCEDSTPGCVIVTLGKNIVIRYRLSDQKQVSSWSSKDQLSAPVIFDFNSKRYVAVFKSDQIAFWHESLVQLNKLKKHKFKRLIYDILSAKDCSPIVVYQNGSIGVLDDEMKSRKTIKNEETFFEETEGILSTNFVSICGNIYVNLLTVIQKTNVKVLHFVPIDGDHAERFLVRLEDRFCGSFNAYTVIEGESTFLITSWSDGSIYSIDLPLKNVKSFPGRVLSKLETLDFSRQSVMLAIGDQQVVMYGAASNSEGAVLCVFNLQYGLIDSLQKLKVYSENPRLWVVGARSTNRYILCQSGGYLVVVPTRLVTQKLCSLVGVAKVDAERDSVEKNFSLPATADWEPIDTCSSPVVQENADHINGMTSEILTLRKSGATDHVICEELLPQLICSLNVEPIVEFLNLVNDVPDHWLIEMAVKFINSPTQKELLEKVFQCPLVSDNASLQLVRSKVTLPVALELLTAISNLMDDHRPHGSLLEWTCLLLDSHYQQYLLTKGEPIMNTVKILNNAVKLQMECMSNLKSLNAELLAIKRGQVLVKKNSVSPHNYLLDTINLYSE